MTIKFQDPVPLLVGVTGTGPGPAVGMMDRVAAVQATTAAGTATVAIEFSNDGTNWVSGIVAALSLNANSQGAVVTAPFKYIRANVTANTGATITASAGF